MGLLAAVSWGTWRNPTMVRVELPRFRIVMSIPIELSSVTHAASMLARRLPSWRVWRMSSRNSVGLGLGLAVLFPGWEAPSASEKGPSPAYAMAVNAIRAITTAAENAAARRDSLRPDFWYLHSAIRFHTAASADAAMIPRAAGRPIWSTCDAV